MTDNPAPAAPPVPAARERVASAQRERVDRLLARPPVESRGSFDGPAGRLEYRAHAAFLPVTASGIEGSGGDARAAVMATAYLLEGADPAQRPVCFAFNGGPGSASLWLHMGALGPKRVVVPDDGSTPRPPYEVADNPHSWFEHFDLVFIDPPHTGWSAAADDEARKWLLSVDGDAEALSDVVRAWLARHRRWASPVYLAGESYGTTRVAAMADRLLGQGVGLAGLVLVSCAMDLQALCFDPGNDLPYALFLPAYAQVAQFHGLLRGAPAASPEAARAAAETFAADEYVAALHAGSRLAPARRARVARRVAELTGLPRDLVEQCNLRIADQTFFVEAMRDQGRIVGRLDARATGPMAASRRRDWEFDPGIESILAPYTMGALDYFGRTLGLQHDERYEVLSRDAHKAWNWNRGDGHGNQYACTSPDLARALRRCAHLRVLVASGRYDLGTPYSATDWTLAQLDVPSEVRVRIEHRYYDAGHMMYTREADLTRLKRDLAAWLG
jgi:carboxypeptidase C (cathepsin A)